jgi:hypothetical protein
VRGLCEVECGLDRDGCARCATCFRTCAYADIETEEKELKSGLSVVAELMQKCIEENARIALDQTEYQDRYDGLVTRFDKAKARYDEIAGLISERKARGEMMDAFIAELQMQDGLITEFDERFWYTLVDFATVSKESDVRFTFKNGAEIQA